MVVEFCGQCFQILLQIIFIRTWWQTNNGNISLYIREATIKLTFIFALLLQQCFSNRKKIPAARNICPVLAKMKVRVLVKVEKCLTEAKWGKKPSPYLPTAASLGRGESGDVQGFLNIYPPSDCHQILVEIHIVEFYQNYQIFFSEHISKWPLSDCYQLNFYQIFSSHQIFSVKMKMILKVIIGSRVESSHFFNKLAT